MKIRSVFLILAVFAVTLIGVVFFLQKGKRAATEQHAPGAEKSTSSPPQTATPPAPVPAHYEMPPTPGSLGLTLSPDKFNGVTRDAYRVAREIPQTLAQLPCYCHCDRGMGHKSLHSCFEDDHAAHCATCVDEALMAYQLQKRGLSPAQIREQIIAQFAD